MRFILSSLILLSILSCGKESPEVTDPVISYTLTVSSGTGGSVNTSGGSYNQGQSVSITATPNPEYVFVNWSNGSTNNPLTVTVNQNITLTANFIKRKYPLTINIEGEGTVREEVVSSGKSTPTEYNSGTTVLLTSLPSDGWEFSNWSGDVESSNSTITVLLNDSKNINVTFSEITLPTITSSLKSKMFTKGVQDTISIGLNIPRGFNSVNVSSELGNVSVFSSPEEGTVNGKLVLEYTNQSVENVLWDRTIAGHDPIEILLTDSNQNTITLTYNIRTQPEPIFRNYNQPMGSFSHGNQSRAKVILEVVEHLNRRSRLNTGCENIDLLSDDEFYELFDSTTRVFDCCDVDDMEDGLLYFNSEFLNRYVSPDWSATYDTKFYPDLNGDGYEDLVFGLKSIEQSGEEPGYRPLPVQFYLYEDGEYVFKEFLFSGAGSIEVKMGIHIQIADIDNDGDPDLLFQGVGDAQGGGYEIYTIPVMLENKLDLDGNGTFQYHSLNLPNHMITHQNGFVDLNFDGLLDIVNLASPNYTVIFNKGNFLFQLPDNEQTNSEMFFDFNDEESQNYNFNPSLQYLNVSENTIFSDFDGDGIIDVFSPGDDDWLLGEQDLPYQPSIPGTKILWGEEHETRVPEINSGNSIITRFNHGRLTEIPRVNGYNETYGAIHKDIDNDGEKELVIHKQLRNYNNNLRTEGYYIQILEFNEREIIDVTSQYIQNNFGVGPKETFYCIPDDVFDGRIRVDDTDGDGNMEIFSIKTYKYGPQKNYFWEWNGSNFVKISEN